MFKLSLQLQKAAQHLRGTTLNVTAVLATLVLLVVPRALAATTATNSCQLKSPKGAIQHVIYVQFDNTHFRRDNPDVPSDLEQMPHLLNFIQDNGVLMSNHHPVLISHTATGICAQSTRARRDLLPAEPGDYSDFNGLFGAKYVNPVIKPSGPMTDLDGTMIQDATGHIGFPGFDGMEATVSLAWVAQMQEAGIPITYAYVSDAHDGHGTAGNIHFAYGPGEAGYTQQLQDYDRAFQKFFDRLAADGINKSNTLFVFTVDEGDHFVGDQPTPAGCDGVTTPCTYNRVGEINANLRRMIFTQFADSTSFSVHSDDAPTVYVNGNPGRTDPTVRQLERESAQLSWLNPYTGQVQNGITVALADPVEEKIL